MYILVAVTGAEAIGITGRRRGHGHRRGAQGGYKCVYSGGKMEAEAIGITGRRRGHGHRRGAERG